MKLMIIPLLFILIGCKSITHEDYINQSNYNEKYNYKWDHWDYYINAIKNEDLYFRWDAAIFVYLISNVKIYVTPTECNDLDLLERLGIRIIIYRHSW